MGMMMVSRREACGGENKVIRLISPNQHSVKIKKAMRDGCLVFGMLSGLFSLHVKAESIEMCSQGVAQSHTISVPFPAKITPSPLGLNQSSANSVVHLDITCNVGATSVDRQNVATLIPRMVVASATVGSTAEQPMLPAEGYGRLALRWGIPRSPNNTLVYSVKFDNVTATCNGTRIAGVPATASQYLDWKMIGHSGPDPINGYQSPSMGAISTLYNGGAVCFGETKLSMDAVFDFYVTSDYNDPTPYSGLLANVATYNRIVPAPSSRINFVVNGVSIEPKLCQISTSGDVQMGKVPAKDIEAGATSNVQTIINITNCPANVGIALTASDVSNPGNTSDTLTLMNASDPGVAKGVGIRFSYGDDNTPITLGQAKRVIANTVEGTQPAIALKARYVKNGPGTVTAGRANAQATLTLSYQ